MFIALVLCNCNTGLSLMQYLLFQDYPTLDAISNVCTESNEIESYDYLRECIDNLENKDSGISLSNSTGTPDIDLPGNSLDDVNLNNIDFNFIKIENLLLQNAEESENYTKSKEVKQEKLLTAVNISDSIESFDAVSLSYNTFSNFSSNSSRESDDISMAINNDEPHTFDIDETIQCQETKTVESYNYSTKFVTENSNGDINSNVDKDSNYAKQSILLESKHEIKIDDLEPSDGVQKCEQCHMTFRYKRHLDRHLEGHKKNNCPHCNGKFARRKHLEVHLFRAHGERSIRHSYSCDVCPRSFPKRALLNRHRAKHNYQNGKVCSECGDMIKIDDKEHEKSCKKRQFKCKLCSQTFSIEQTYLHHIQNHNNHKCPNCDVSFASKKKAHEHFKAVHTPKLNDSDAANGKY